MTSEGLAFPQPSMWVAKKKITTNPFIEEGVPPEVTPHKRGRGRPRKNDIISEKPSKVPKTKSCDQGSSVCGNELSAHFEDDVSDSASTVESPNISTPIGNNLWELLYEGIFYTFRELLADDHVCIGRKMLVKYGQKGPHFGLLYPATITAVHSNNTFSIKFIDGETDHNTARDAMYVVTRIAT